MKRCRAFSKHKWTPRSGATDLTDSLHTNVHAADRAQNRLRSKKKQWRWRPNEGQTGLPHGGCPVGVFPGGAGGILSEAGRFQRGREERGSCCNVPKQVRKKRHRLTGRTLYDGRSWEGGWDRSILGPPAGTHPADTLIVDAQPPDGYLWKRSSCISKASGKYCQVVVQKARISDSPQTTCLWFEASQTFPCGRSFLRVSTLGLDTPITTEKHSGRRAQAGQV
ncbi:PREDICTED: uncharacterized protein LOC109387589 [Hipposideros armiger]|uniref:Uncharacterized protein LOC109387589 n=1 Tax=Hipposideros armiger TaxID=186990 RepID=A0A8B7S684_HIPAR|nr:PREDICTED: uncharacterized protein LOC109387589 [Hipposideros armiger]